MASRKRRSAAVDDQAPPAPDAKKRKQRLTGEEALAEAFGDTTDEDDEDPDKFFETPRGRRVLRSISVLSGPPTPLMIDDGGANYDLGVGVSDVMMSHVYQQATSESSDSEVTVVCGASSTGLTYAQVVVALHFVAANEHLEVYTIKLHALTEHIVRQIELVLFARPFRLLRKFSIEIGHPVCPASLCDDLRAVLERGMPRPEPGAHANFAIMYASSSQ